MAGMSDPMATVAGFTLPTPAHLILLAILIIGAGMWMGGMVAVAMLAAISKKALDPATRTQFFRRYARTYFPVFGTALVVAAIAGFVMLLARGFDGIAWAITILVIVTMVALAFGVVQARAMTRLRAQAADLGDTAPPELAETIRRQGRAAAALRGSLGVLSLAVFVLAIATAA